MSLTLPKIYPITDTVLSGLSHRDQVEQLIAGGASIIQLREKQIAPRDFLNDARIATNLAHAAQVKIIINDRVDIAMAIGADGVHLGQTDMPVEAARRLLGDAAIVGFSTHNPHQVESALRLPIDYLAFGPIFATKTKQNPDSVVGMELLREVKTRAGSIPLIAIGGITSQTVQPVLTAGVDAVAVISALYSDKDSIAKNLRKLDEIAERLLTH